MIQLTDDSTALINASAAAASAVAALASVFVAIRLGRRAEELAKAEELRQERFAGEEAARQRDSEEAEERRSAFTSVAEWRRDLFYWAAEAIDVLSEATYVCETLADDIEGSRAGFLVHRYRLSALIDRGRLYLPNLRVEEHGQNKPYAYRGYRHAGLDPLVAAERILSNGEIGRFVDRKHALIAMKGEFVSSVQRILDPSHYNAELLGKIARGSAAVDIDRHPLADTTTIPRGATALLYNPPSYHLGLRDPVDERASDGPGTGRRGD